MDKRRRMWILAFWLGLAGCGGDGAAPSSTETPTSGTQPGPVAAKPAPATGGSAAQPAPPVTKGTPETATPSKEAAGKGEAPPLEGPSSSNAESARPVVLAEAEIARIKTLPPAEAEAALKQAVCPVSGDHLGNMGTPFKITAENRTFYLCCKGCVDDVKADPKSVIAKLDKK